jgi:dethiobiotin synthetase
VVVLVADAGLGTINAVRLSLEALDRGAHLATLLVHLNRYDGSDELHRANRAWLAERHGLDVEVTLADLAARLRGLGPEA